MKLNKLQKSDLKFYKRESKVDGIKIISIDDVVTIAWKRQFKGSKMVCVSTSYYDTNEEDRFRKSTGKFYALARMYAGQYTQIPVGELADVTVEAVLENMFVI